MTFNKLIKNTHLLIIILCVFSCSATPIKKLAFIAASGLAAYPMLSNAFLSAQNYLERDKLVGRLEDVDSKIDKFVRKRLTAQGYKTAKNLPIKAYENGFFRMETQLDLSLGFSKDYEARIKDLLEKQENSCLDDSEEIELRNFVTDLDHEMFHIQDQHANKSIAMEVAIPVATEILTLPLIKKLYKSKSTAGLATGLLASVALKLIINKNLEIIHRKYQEQSADNWALNKNGDFDSLNAFNKFRRAIPKNGCDGLAMEYIEFGKSGSTIFNMLIKLFDNSLNNIDPERCFGDSEYTEQSWQEIDNFYKKLKRQPLQWPLRALSYTFDPYHPFALDSAKMAKNKIKELKEANQSRSQS